MTIMVHAQAKSGLLAGLLMHGTSGTGHLLRGGGGGLKNGRGVHVKFYPYEKGGGSGEVLPCLEGGWGGGGVGGGRKKFRTRDFPVLWSLPSP